MKVLYYVEKELAQFDPARRLRGRCERRVSRGPAGIHSKRGRGWGAPNAGSF